MSSGGGFDFALILLLSGGGAGPSGPWIGIEAAAVEPAAINAFWTSVAVAGSFFRLFLELDCRRAVMLDRNRIIPVQIWKPSNNITAAGAVDREFFFCF